MNSSSQTEEHELARIPAEAPGPAQHARSKIRITAIMLAIYLSLFIAALDQTVIATAIPTISTQLHSSSGQAWIGGAYQLANAAAAPIWAKLSDIWGRKPILLIAVGMFFASSILCATATSMKMLIAGRAILGTSGGGLTQMTSITISDLFSMRLRSLHFGLLGLVWSVAGGLGPILGGAFTEFLSWRWTFWINLPISGAAFVLLWGFLDVHNPRTRFVEGVKAIDWLGSLSLVALVLMLLLGLDFGGATFPWNSPTVICLIVFGGLMTIFFILSEKRLARYPLMPLGIFREKSNVASLALCFMHGFVALAGEFYLPLFFQSVKHASPFHSGLLTLPITLAEGILAVFTGILMHRFGRYREVMWVGTAIMVLGNGLYIKMAAASSLAELVIFQIVAGIGAGMLFDSPVIAIQAMVSQQDTAAATSTLWLIRNIGSSVAVVVAGVVFQNGVDDRVHGLVNAGVPTTVTDKLAGGEAAAHASILGTISDPSQRAAVQHAFAGAFRNIWILTTCVASVAMAASTFIAKKRLSTEHVETKTGLEEMKVSRVNTTA
ncbi:putative MFS transporter [Lineolata rhizophorae]|uniref:Putative MFS transporter n=1 Tax=Lineolata rhizophorae TaxID=578093 RepID=A0A6A6PBZ9_9PEZI|nr:putative MFS transporter [Lineolata rhizophorae]